ncbi:NAD-dependent epimerase [Luminiphilus sp.]|nr:NAD-dependent epimerase [Luminiphilus sp.]
MILVTGAAGFIGFHLTMALLSRGDTVIGVDNINDYYDSELKLDRLREIDKHTKRDSFTFLNLDIADRNAMAILFADYEFDVVVNFAAQAGVRYSLENPNAYVDSNLVGFMNILEGCRYCKVKHLVYASSSSVYGMNTRQPFSTNDKTDSPISLYAATKKSNEALAHSYSHLFEIPTTGLRFFTVYGPFGRPDMAYFKFTRAIMNGDPIPVYNNGDLERDFTYIDDIVEGVIRIMNKVPRSQKLNATTESPPYRIYNIGNNNPVSLMSFIETIEEFCGRKAVKEFLPMQAGDVYSTYANIDDLQNAIGFSPKTPMKKGIESFVSWYREKYL